AFAAREAGVKRLVEKDDPRLLLTEHPQSDGSCLVVAVNTHDKPVDFSVKVDGKVGRVWNGTLKDDVLSIRENDGCVFEVTPNGK
nr:hypothetical protein [Kiritimatiellia bacterium]